MEELNSHDPIEIQVIDGYNFKLKCDTTKFAPY